MMKDFEDKETTQSTGVIESVVGVVVVVAGTSYMLHNLYYSFINLFPGLF